MSISYLCENYAIDYLVGRGAKRDVYDSDISHYDTAPVMVGVYQLAQSLDVIHRVRNEILFHWKGQGK